MTKKGLFALFTVLFSINLVSALSIGDFLDVFGFENLLLVATFIISFAVLFFILSKFFRSRTPRGTVSHAIPVVISLALSLLIVYGVHAMDFSLGGFFFDLGVGEDLLTWIVVGVVSLGVLILLWKLRSKTLLIIGLLLLILGTFTTVFEEDTATAITGGVLVFIWFLYWFLFKRKKKSLASGSLTPGKKGLFRKAAGWGGKKALKGGGWLGKKAAQKAWAQRPTTVAKHAKAMKKQQKIQEKYERKRLKAAQKAEIRKQKRFEKRLKASKKARKKGYLVGGPDLPRPGQGQAVGTEARAQQMQADVRVQMQAEQQARERQRAQEAARMQEEVRRQQEAERQRNVQQSAQQQQVQVQQTAANLQQRYNAYVEENTRLYNENGKNIGKLKTNNPQAYKLWQENGKAMRLIEKYAKENKVPLYNSKGQKISG